MAGTSTQGADDAGRPSPAKSPRHLVYDGTFDGFLSALAWCYRTGIVAADISTDPPDGLFTDSTPIETDAATSEAMQATLARRLGPAALRTVAHAFRSGAAGKEMAIWNYLQLGRQAGRRLTEMLAHEAVVALNRLAFQVRHEAHRLKGFVRFQEVEGRFYYAAIEPDHDVLAIMALHFAERFHDQHWMIHDRQREKAVLYDRKRREWLEAPVSLNCAPTFSEREGELLELWQTFFTALNIETRKNLPLQRQKVPMRYRKHLVEFGLQGVSPCIQNSTE